MGGDFATMFCLPLWFQISVIKRWKIKQEKPKITYPSNTRKRKEKRQGLIFHGQKYTGLKNRFGYYSHNWKRLKGAVSKTTHGAGKTWSSFLPKAFLKLLIVLINFCFRTNFGWRNSSSAVKSTWRYYSGSEFSPHPGAHSSLELLLQWLDTPFWHPWPPAHLWHFLTQIHIKITIK